MSVLKLVCEYRCKGDFAIRRRPGVLVPHWEHDASVVSGVLEVLSLCSSRKSLPPHRQSGMLATLKGNVGERFFGPNLLPSPALLCTTFYRCSDIQHVDGEILAEIARKLNLLNICVNIS